MILENEIIKLLNEGNEEAIKLIFDKYYESLCLFAESIIKDHQKSEEIVEDIFIYLWINIKKNPIHFSVKNYLFTSTRNNCLKYLVKLKSEKKIIEQSQYSLEDYEILNQISSNYPASNLILKELENKAEMVFLSLPKQCREIYSLNRFENLTYSEIAKKLNLTIGTVKTQMSRAFLKFKKELKDYIPLILFITFLQ
jgi:RNA polymerase sigma-70 factor (ECF subfamily)